MNKSALPRTKCVTIDRFERERRSGGTPRRALFWIAGLSLLFIQCTLTGCASLSQRAEINPDGWAPPEVTAEWVPGKAKVRGATLKANEANPPGWSATPVKPVYDLSGLADLALRNNPATRRQWQVARA